MRLSNGPKHAVFSRFAGPTTRLAIKDLQRGALFQERIKNKQNKLQMVRKNILIGLINAGDRENAVGCCHSSFCNIII